MKRCPNCKRTFEDDLTYCLIDGSILSAPFEEESGDSDSMATEVLPASARTPAPTERIPPPQPTIAAGYTSPQPAFRDIPSTEGVSAGLIAIIAAVTIFYVVAIAILSTVYSHSLSPYIGSLLMRRTPVFTMAVIGIVLALIRIKHHPRVSLLTILALLIWVLQGLFFYVLGAALNDIIARMKLSVAASEWAFFFIYFFEDFIFAAVIILLVVAAYKGRNQVSRPAPETS